MKKKYVVSVVLALIGICLLIYPFASSYVNSLQQNEVVTEYETVVENKNSDEVEKQYKKAKEYNQKITKTIGNDNEYNNILNFTEDGMIGSINIPKVNVNLPIYHGTDDITLSHGIGHFQSFPIGDENSHAVLVGHSGMMSQEMFTNITQLKIGDIFTVTVANREVTYEIDQIKTVLPDETEDLKIEKGKSYCTLLTCVPYGVNSHRLLVRGHKVSINDYSKEEIEVKNNKIVTFTDKLGILSLVIGLTIMLSVPVVVYSVRKRTNERNEEKKQ